MNKESIFKISFINNGTVYEIYSKSVAESSLFGFIEVAELVFGNAAGVVVDPSQERLKTEFQGVKTSYIPLHSIVRIDEVEQEGIAKIVEMSKTRSNVMPFPSPFYRSNSEPVT